jgi:hypothetical protein
MHTSRVKALRSNEFQTLLHDVTRTNALKYCDAISFEWLDIFQKTDPKLLPEEEVELEMDQITALITHG